MAKEAKPRIGRQILEVLTSGMYNNPLMVLREYVQNSADAVDSAVADQLLNQGDARISIELDGRGRSIQIEDNGCGVANSSIESVLCSVGRSTKDRTTNRGFRGIGRLGGLGYAKKVRFETRTDADDSIGIVEWDTERLAGYVSRDRSLKLDDALRAAVNVSFTTPSPDDSRRFFRVTLDGIRPFHSDALMNVSVVSQYISQVAPVPLHRKTFRFGEMLEGVLAKVAGYRSYFITVNGEQVHRPYADEIRDRKKKVLDRIHDVQVFDIPGPAGIRMGRGWYAETNLLAALPPSVLMRGIRVRHGNIGVGDEYFLSNVFAERRFASWHVGELHLDSSVTLNARRDDFEQSAAYEKFLEHASIIGKHLSRLCRVSSDKRSAASYLNGCLSQVEDFITTEYFLDKAHYEKRLRDARTTLEKVLTALGDGHSDNTDLKERYLKAESRLHGDASNPVLIAQCLDGRKMRNVTNKQLMLDVCGRLAIDENGTARSLDDIIEVVRPYLRT